MCSQMGSHLDNHDILHQNQHGFHKGLSSETQLVQDWASSINSKGQTDVILLDFSIYKAFDKVSHRKLLHKIHHYGIKGKTKSWITAFLDSRQQQVVVNGRASNTADVLSGVPQGTVLGPMLFLLYINDITDGVSSTMRQFADDSILYRDIHDPRDHETLVADINTLHDWAKTWQMDFNVSKCAVLTITNKRKPSTHIYTMNGQEIPRRDKYDYLGVTIDPKLSWKDHISRVCGKANRTLGLVKRTLHTAPQQVHKTAYETLVRPSLEYATCAWSPHTQSTIKKVEQVQRAAARFVCGDYRRRSSVTSMCSTLEWDTLEQRRRLRDVTLFYKIKHGLVGITLPLVLIPADSRTRCQNTDKLRVVTSSCLTYQYSYFVRCVPFWNHLPQSAIDAQTVAQFQTAAFPTIRAL